MTLQNPMFHLWTEHKTVFSTVHFIAASGCLISCIQGEMLAGPQALLHGSACWCCQAMPSLRSWRVGCVLVLSAWLIQTLVYLSLSAGWAPSQLVLPPHQRFSTSHIWFTELMVTASGALYALMVLPQSVCITYLAAHFAYVLSVLGTVGVAPSLPATLAKAWASALLVLALACMAKRVEGRLALTAAVKASQKLGPGRISMLQGTTQPHAHVRTQKAGSSNSSSTSITALERGSSDTGTSCSPSDSAMQLRGLCFKRQECVISDSASVGDPEPDPGASSLGAQHVSAAGPLLAPGDSQSKTLPRLSATAVRYQFLSNPSSSAPPQAPIHTGLISPLEGKACPGLRAPHSSASGPPSGLAAPDWRADHPAGPLSSESNPHRTAAARMPLASSAPPALLSPPRVPPVATQAAAATCTPTQTRIQALLQQRHLLSRGAVWQAPAASGPSPSAFQPSGIHTAQDMLREHPTRIRPMLRAAALRMLVQDSRTYRPAAASTRVMIKMQDTDPDQLAPNIIGALTRVLNDQSHTRYCIVRAGVRKGCTLIQLHITRSAMDSAGALLPHPLGNEPSTGGCDGRSQPLLAEHMIQALLGALQSPELPLPMEGSKAHISCDEQLVNMSWHQHSWALAPAVIPLPSSPAAVSSLTLVHMESAVARLPTLMTKVQQRMAQEKEDTCRSCAEDSAKITSHRVALLLRSQGLHTMPGCFIGSDARGGAEVVAGGGKKHHHKERYGISSLLPQGIAGTVTVCAHTPGGLYLPVSVADWETGEAGSEGEDPDSSDTDSSDWEEEEEGEAVVSSLSTFSSAAPAGSSEPRLCALLLDVDLMTACDAGAVQLELWQGHTLLVSAPLLLLPALIGAPTTLAPDLLLADVHQCLAHSSWEQAQPHQLSSAGMGPYLGLSAWMSDLGQVLYAAAVPDQTLPTGITQATALPATLSSGSWGGVADSLPKQYATDCDLIASTITMAEALLTFAQQEQGVHVTEIISSCTSILRTRLVGLQAAHPQAARPDIQAAALQQHLQK